MHTKNLNKTFLTHLPLETLEHEYDFKKVEKASRPKHVNVNGIMGLDNGPININFLLNLFQRFLIILLREQGVHFTSLRFKHSESNVTVSVETKEQFLIRTIYNCNVI